MSWFPNLFYRAAFLSFSKEAMQINPWASPAPLLTAASSSQQEKNCSSMAHGEHCRDQLFRAPFPNSPCRLLNKWQHRDSLLVTYFALWKEKNWGWLASAPKGAPSSSKAAPSSSLRHLRTPQHQPQRCSHLQLLPKAPSGTWTPMYARSLLHHRIKHLQNTSNYETAGSKSFLFQLSLHY